MSTRDRTPDVATPGLVFEVERFEWAEGGRLELVGRWSGLRGHRFLRPTLDVVVDGERRRMLADLEHKPWAPDEDKEWIAAFAWRGEPARFEEAELTVSPDLAVALPSPGGAARPAKGRAKKASGAELDRLPARRPRSAVLEAELGAALAESGELREQLRAEQTNVRGLESQLGQAREEVAMAQAERDEARAAADRARADAEKARARAEAERERADAERDRAEAERARAEAEAAKAENAEPDARKLRADLDEATRERDAALERLSAADRERRALAEARDRARDERNAWMQRARAVAAGRPSAARAAAEAATAEPPPAHAPAADTAAEPPTVALDQGAATMPAVEADAPEPAALADRRTIQIGERPGALRPPPAAPVQTPGRRLFLDRWGPRLLAALVLAVLAVAVLLIVLFAL